MKQISGKLAGLDFNIINKPIFGSLLTSQRTIKIHLRESLVATYKEKIELAISSGAQVTLWGDSIYMGDDEEIFIIQGIKFEKKTILIVEDDPATLEALSTFLEMEGYLILSATQGKEALAVLENQTPALIILDMLMPIMNGQEFLETKKLDPRFKNLPVIVLSAKTEELRNEKLAGVFQKPLHLDILLNHIKKVA